MMINCRKAAELTCAGLDRPLSLREAAALRLHLLLCAACKEFKRQNEALIRLFEQRFRSPGQGGEGASLPELPENACERLKRRLREAADEKSHLG